MSLDLRPGALDDPEGAFERVFSPERGWEDMRAAFRWPRPERLNIAEALVGRRAAFEPDRLALRHLDAEGRVEDWSYAVLDRAGRRLANALAAKGVGRGDRVAILLQQSPEALIAHLAAYRLGAVAMPLTTLFGAEALRHRLSDSGARALVTYGACVAKLDREAAPALRLVLAVDGAGDGAEDFHALLAAASEAHEAAETGPDDPALLSYTSGTTGPAKGALHGHRVLHGHLAGARLAYDFLPRAHDVMWTPADWAWMGGLCNAMMPALYWGVPLISHRMEKFDPERAWSLMAAQGVTTAFMPPTALRLMRQATPPAGLRLRSVASAGEALGAGLVEWGRGALGLEIAEFYGQTECNMALANCPRLFPVRPGSMGRVVPGCEVAVIDVDGRPLPPGETGEIAMRRGAAAMFLGYWNRPEKTAEKFKGEWMRSGDEGRIDAEGYVWFAGRSDDVITSAGYRIGPSEIEDCLMAHPAVALAAAVGLPDPVRTEIVAAAVTLRPGAASEGLAEALSAHVRERLGGHLAPRRVEIVEAMPVTTTGKIMRREVRRRLMEEG